MFLKLFYNIMIFPAVYIHGTFAHKTTVTNVACVRPFASVLPEMNNPRRVLRERLSAHVTPIRFLPGMQACVQPQAVLPGESFTAHFTL